MTGPKRDTRVPLPILLSVLWLTRIGGAVFALGGLGFFVVAWQDGTFAPVAMGLATLAFGIVCMSIRRTQEGGLEYGLENAMRLAAASRHNDDNAA